METDAQVTEEKFDGLFQEDNPDRDDVLFGEDPPEEQVEVKVDEVAQVEGEPSVDELKERIRRLEQSNKDKDYYTEELKGLLKSINSPQPTKQTVQESEALADKFRQEEWGDEVVGLAGTVDELKAQLNQTKQMEVERINAEYNATVNEFVAQHKLDDPNNRELTNAFIDDFNDRLGTYTLTDIDTLIKNGEPVPPAILRNIKGKMQKSLVLAKSMVATGTKRKEADEIVRRRSETPDPTPSFGAGNGGKPDMSNMTYQEALAACKISL